MRDRHVENVMYQRHSFASIIVYELKINLN